MEISSKEQDCLVNYYHQFIKGYSELIKPLTDLLKGDSRRKINYDNRHDNVLETSKKLFPTSPTLLAHNRSKTFILGTDCCFG